ncbi:MAG: bacterial Ig-like domain-containing protein, partial [Clostridia bacterium]|nr:bacterial Ig-like domain-containing protein [Clostridia bacterium]
MEKTKTMKKGFFTFACSIIFVFVSLFGLTACGNPVKSLALDKTGTTFTDEFAYGENFSAAGLKVKLTYNDDTTENITYADFSENKITIDSSAYKKTIAGEYSIYVIYNESDTIRGSYTVTVNEPTLNGITVTGPTKKAYAYGEALDLTGLVVQKTYAETLAANVTVAEEDYTIDDSEYDANTAGTYTITVSLDETTYTATFTVTVATTTLDSIVIGTPATKLTYAYGETLDLTGLVVEKHFTEAAANNEAIL